MHPNSRLWKILEFYGTRISHRGKWRVHEYLRSWLHANCDCDLEVERQGLRWCLNPSDFVQTHLYWTGEYEPWDLLHLSRWLQPGAVVFDVGSNFGYYSIRLASVMQGEGQVFAFEPSRATFLRLKTNITLNGLQSKINATCCGLAERSGSAHLDQIPGNSGAATLSSGSTGEAITLDTLDHFCESRKLSRIDLIKIDVEGHEVGVVRGGMAVISRYRPVMMIEFNSSALEKAGASVDQLRDLLHSLGYQVFMAKRDRLLRLDTLPSDPMVLNVFCIPEGVDAQNPGNRSRLKR